MTTVDETRQRYHALNEARRQDKAPLLDSETMLEFLLTNRDRAVLEGCLNLSNRQPADIPIRTKSESVIVEVVTTVAPGVTIVRYQRRIRSSFKIWQRCQQELVQSNPPTGEHTS